MGYIYLSDGIMHQLVSILEQMEIINIRTRKHEATNIKLQSTWI